MNLIAFLAFLVGSILPLIYIPLIIGNPRRVNFRILFYGLGGGLISGLGIITFKFLFFQKGMHLPTQEVLTLTLFTSLIEAGLLEECFKNGLYLLCLCLLKKQVNFSSNKYSYFALAAFVGLGFGILETAFYASNLKYEITIIWDRVYTTIPAHMIMNILFGFLISERINPVIALLGSISFHAAYDFFAIPSTLLGGVLLRVLLIIGFGFCLWAGKYLLSQSSQLQSSPKILGGQKT
ncbi:MAG: PrsW family glutamic-type intramembrane protease [Candidatus Caenarcaniphilales bacterium]|nr:PrsW family glutamic-type intramembrane protease [Candidatus Caenarcaniphilales bacterium]